MSKKTVHSKIKILIADDVADERELIESRLQEIFFADSLELQQSVDVDDALAKIRKIDFDFVFSDMSFVGNKDDGGKIILTAAAKKSNKTRLFLFSHYRSKSTPIKAEEELKALKISFSVIGKDPDDFPISDFKNSVDSEFRKWTSYQCLKIQREEVAALCKLIKPSTFSENEIVSVGKDKWRIKDLFFTVDWKNKGNHSSIYSQINEYLIRYPVVTLEAWTKPNKGKFTLPIVDYYEELYFNPAFADVVQEQINPESERLLNLILKVLAFDKLSLSNSKTTALTALRDSRLINNYTGIVPGKDPKTNELLPKAMPSFIYKLIGRQAALGCYLLFCLTPIEINNLLMYGTLSATASDNNDAYKQLISQSLFLENTNDNSLDHIKYGLYPHIYKNVSEDERAFLKSWWNKIPAFLTDECGLNQAQITTVLSVTTKPFQYFQLS